MLLYFISPSLSSFKPTLLIMSSKLLIFTLTISTQLIFYLGHINAIGADPIGCFVQGECVDSTVSGVYFDEKINDCVDSCQSVLECLFFSYLPDDGVCIIYEDCPKLSIDSCPACVSGDSICPNKICEVEGMFLLNINSLLYKNTIKVSGKRYYPQVLSKSRWACNWCWWPTLY